MDREVALAAAGEEMLRAILTEITGPDGAVATERFPDLRSVDAKVREAKLVISSMAGLPEALAAEMASDYDFSANSRRIRLEALSNYCIAALRFLDAGTGTDGTKPLLPLPDIHSVVPPQDKLHGCLEGRWTEAQLCARAGAYTAAVVMMGSVLEGLLLARAKSDPGRAFSAKAAPRKKDGSNSPIDDWGLNSLLDVAAELGWVKSDRAAFGHALRQSRNVVHPLIALKSGADFDLATARTSWSVLTAAIRDLAASSSTTG